MVEKLQSAVECIVLVCRLHIESFSCFNRPQSGVIAGSKVQKVGPELHEILWDLPTDPEAVGVRADADSA